MKVLQGFRQLALDALVVSFFLLFAHSDYAKAATTVTTPVAKINDVRNYVPRQAIPLIPLFHLAIDDVWPNMQPREYFMALADLESCVSYKATKCFNTKSKLNTARETGVGLGQITIAYRLKAGANKKDFGARQSVRFDALAENKHLHTKLKALTWDNITDRADLQILLMVAMVKKANDAFLKSTPYPMERLRFADAAYNGGIAGTKSRIIKCAGTINCNPQIWFGHAEKTCTASRKALYGSRSACDINNHHVEETTVVRLGKYKNLMKRL